VLRMVPYLAVQINGIKRHGLWLLGLWCRWCRVHAAKLQPKHVGAQGDLISGLRRELVEELGDRITVRQVQRVEKDV
jgi:hypothetical protein